MGHNSPCMQCKICHSSNPIKAFANNLYTKDLIKKIHPIAEYHHEIGKSRDVDTAFLPKIDLN